MRVYIQNIRRDLLMVLKASASNLLARLAPRFYVNLTGQTGRGAGESPEHVADYFRQCLEDYRVRLVPAEGDFGAFLQGKQVLEYGPGDTLGVALLLYAHGAQHVECVDRFAMESASPSAVRTYRLLLEGLPPTCRERAAAAFNTPGDCASGLNPDCIRYRVTPDGLAGVDGVYDLVLSRAVLEHVNSLAGTFADIERGLRVGGISLHCVDLRSHNLDRDCPLDFLTWPDWLYRLMYSHKGFPNRWRVGHYRDLIAVSSLELMVMEPTELLDPTQLASVAGHMAPQFRQGSLHDLAWLGFWMQLRKPAAPRLGANAS